MNEKLLRSIMNNWSCLRITYRFEIFSIILCFYFVWQYNVIFNQLTIFDVIAFIVKNSFINLMPCFLSFSIKEESQWGSCGQSFVTFLIWKTLYTYHISVEKNSKNEKASLRNLLRHILVCYQFVAVGLNDTS